MKRIAMASLVVGALALSACSKDRLGDEYGTGGLGGDYVAGSPSDPKSPAYFQQTIGDRVLFAIDQSTLSAENTEILNKQAAWLMENPAYTAIVEGHADEQGTREYNLALGARRASAVNNYLIERGVAPNRLQTVSYGKERPLEICSTEVCYAKNRRAVTVLAAGAATS
ncbi:peptidoglycan-associated lipoprotein Pal [Aliiroseovarius sediminis]|uniref:peptidoglycan-associated lipoprotein Pal n=1 Tax=Aliiroseovarius sediminis TaxID=2925839 RepID=UPI001F58B6D2|nr:peptidoglycan-associated lipoprotein Pal [Aliiroseovarius sediminis]MCI2392952.1 peptidoglycan-associated lipoprotein Pal [Aliiroseovarius sediminis]